MNLLRATLLVAVAACAARGECVKVEGGRILASQLAGILPAMAGVPAGAVIGFTPKLGVVRWLAPGEIQKAAARHSVHVEVPEPVCIERRGAAIDQRELTHALETALRRAGHSDFSLNVLDYPRTPLPQGVLEFPVTGIAAPPAGRRDTLWRGRLRVEGGQSVPLVVRVEASVEAVELRAARDVAPGQVITAEDLAQSTRRVVPGTAPLTMRLEEAIGRQARRAIKAGGLVHPKLLASPPEVQRGDRVLVAVASGGATIAVEATAETAARTGQTVVLANPSSGKRFKAIVAGRGRAELRLENSIDEKDRQ